MCSVSASRLNTVDMAAYMLNCIYAMQTVLSLYEFTDARLEMLQAQVCVDEIEFVGISAIYQLY